MRSHGIAPNAASIKPAPRNPKCERQQSLPSSSSPSGAKKRKTEGYLDENSAADDDEGFGMVKPEPALAIKEQLVVKEEEAHQHQQQQQPGQLSLGEAANLMQYYDTPTRYSGDGLSMEGEYKSYDAGMASPSISSPYGLGAPPSYSFSSHAHSHSHAQPASHSPYGSSEMGAGLGGMHIGEQQRASPYQQLMPYSSDGPGGPGQGQGQGRPDSPVVLE